MFYIIGNYWSKFTYETSKNINHLHKEVNDLQSVIILLVIYVRGGETIFLWNYYEWYWGKSTCY